MGRANTQFQGAEGWKRKYLTSLERLERQEKQWAEIESLLRLAVRRLSLAADGVDPVLNRQLAEVRRVVRNVDENPKLGRLVDEISQTVERLDQQRSRGEHCAPSPAEALLQLFDSVPWPRGIRKKAGQLRKRLKAVNETPKVLQDFARLITDALACAAEPADPAITELSTDAGDRDRHHARTASEDVPSAESSSQVIDSGREQSFPISTARILLDILDYVHIPGEKSSRIETLRERIRRAQDAKGLRKLTVEVVEMLSPQSWEAHDAGQHGRDIMSRLQEVLLQLLDYMGLPEDLVPQARKLEEKLTSKLNDQQLTDVLQQIAGLVSQLRSRVDKEKQEIEAFLIQLTERLQDLGRHVQAAKSQQRASFDSGRELGEMVRNQVQDIESSVNKASNLDQLKLVAQERLESIRDDLDAYRHSEEQSHARMEREVEMLTSRLQEMENECTELRERAKREHMQAVSDALTGVFNRSAYETRLAQECARWKRYQTPFAVMLWDVDGFKSINDTYGHTAGDNALKLIAGALKDNLRDADFIARYGGDEFAALLSETEMGTAMVVAEKLRAAITYANFHHRGTKVPITLSCGIASIHDGDTPDAVFERADAALYRAKRGGKNRCESESS